MVFFAVWEKIKRCIEQGISEIPREFTCRDRIGGRYLIAVERFNPRDEIRLTWQRHGKPQPPHKLSFSIQTHELTNLAREELSLVLARLAPTLKPGDKPLRTPTLLSGTCYVRAIKDKKGVAYTITTPQGVILYTMPAPHAPLPRTSL